jgi:aryl-alcohol dehydrogenase-like predicted oxidoreductase
MGDHDVSKLGLGTVQFGSDYGISNTAGQTSSKDVKDILAEAMKQGITTIDTAHLYGNSEEVLGKSLPSDYVFDVITKTTPVKRAEILPEDIEAVKNGFEESLRRLGKNNIYGLLLHHADDLKSSNAEALYGYLSQVREEGRVKKIGVSVYDNDQIDYILDRFKIDLIQIPMNIFDQRLLRSGALDRLKKQNIEIHVRSVFLQGVVFMEPEGLPAHLQGLSRPVEHLRALAERHDTNVASVALAFLAGNENVDKIICGVDNLKQFKDLIKSLSSLPEIEKTLFSSLAVDDPKLVNPAEWQNIEG